MLSTHDDYPIHQTPDPVAQPGTTDPNFYDRYWFNGYDRDGAFYFGIALGLYPNRRVMDASFTILKGGVQHSLHASRLAPDDPCETRVGPLRLEVEVPMRVVRVAIERNATGVECDLRFRARTACVREARSPMVRDRRTVMDTTRFTQLGRWEGRVVAHGEETRVDAERTLATRDRSWGIRPVGEPVGGRPAGDGQHFHIWAPLHFDDVCAHAVSFERADGEAWDQSAYLMPAYAKIEEIPGVEDPGTRKLLGVRHQLRWRPGTRWVCGGVLELVRGHGESERIELVEPLLRGQMLGLGYVHPEWGHGRWHGEEALAGETWRPGDLDPADLRTRHVQEVFRARWGTREGVGVLEQMIVGPYAPAGFREFNDLAADPEAPPQSP